MSDEIQPQTPYALAEDPAAEPAPAAPENVAPVDEGQAPNDPSASPDAAAPVSDTDPSNAGEPQATDAPAADGSSAAPSDAEPAPVTDAPAPSESAPSDPAPASDAPAEDAPTDAAPSDARSDAAPAPLEPTQAPVGEGYPVATGNPIAHPTTGEPLPTEQQPGGDASAPAPSDSAPAEDAPTDAAPAPAEPAPVEPPAAVPAAPTTPDVYGVLTQQGAQIVADAEKLADNAGVVLAARIKTVANAAASLNDMIRAIIAESEDDAADELCTLSDTLDSLAYHLVPFIGDAEQADDQSLMEKIKAAVQGLEDHLKGVFKKLTGA